jgi:hypothetical protein
VAEKTRDPRIPPLAKRGNLLPLGRGFAETRRTQGTGQRWGYHVAGPGRNPSRKGDTLLARGSAVRIPGGLWPSALFRGAAKTNGEGEVGQFAICEDDREPQNQGRHD